MPFKIPPPAHRLLENIPQQHKAAAQAADKSRNGIVTSYELDQSIADASPEKRMMFEALEQYFLNLADTERLNRLFHPSSDSAYIPYLREFMLRIPESLLSKLEERGVRFLVTKNGRPGKASFHFAIESILHSVAEHKKGSVTASLQGSSENELGQPRTLIHEIAHALDYDNLHRHPDLDAGQNRFIGDGILFRASMQKDFYQIFETQNAVIKNVLGTYFAAAASEFFAESFVLHVCDNPLIDQIPGLRPFWDEQQRAGYPLFDAPTYSLEEGMALSEKIMKEIMAAKYMQYDSSQMISYTIQKDEHVLSYFPDLE